MTDAIDGPLLRRLHDRGNDRLRIFKIDVAGDVGTEETALLLPMDHGDDPRFVRRLNRTNGLSAFDRGPATHQQRLQSHRSNQYPNYAREIERHDRLRHLTRDHYPQPNVRGLVSDLAAPLRCARRARRAPCLAASRASLATCQLTTPREHR